MTPITPESLWSLPRVGNPLALGGGRILVPVTTYEDGSTTTLWRIDLDTGERRRFASGKISKPCLAGDGSAVAYLKQTSSDHAQVHVQPVDGGEGREAVELPLGAVGVRWLPDGRLIALATLWRDHPTLEATADHEPDPEFQVRATENAVYQYWDTWLDHVYHPVIIDPDTGELTDLTPGATRFWTWPSTGDPGRDIDGSPDGKLIAFAADDSAAPHRELSWSLFLIRADGSDLRRLDPGDEGHSRRPRFTPDGDALVYGYQPEPDFYASPTRLIRHDLATGDTTQLAEGWELSPADWTFSPDGHLYFTAEDRGRNPLWRLDPAASEPIRLTEHGWVAEPSISPQGEVFTAASSLTAPPEVHRILDRDGKPATEAVTDFTAGVMRALDMGSVRELTISGADDDDVQVWLVDPPGAHSGEPLPLVHLIHGGPHGVFGDTWHWRWNAQVVAGAGYRVAMVNFHGSTGWGDSFTRSIHGAWGDLPYRDIEAATDHLVEAGLADESRMAVTGGSYGGYLTAWITAQTDRYACAIAHAAVTNLGGMYASDVTYGRARSYGAEIWDDREAVERWSPSAHAAGYSTPTLVVHGHRDARVPVTQGLELYGVLIAKGINTRLVSFPTENHWILDRAHSIRWYREFLDWLERWL